MKKSIRKGFSRVLAGCLATVITAVGLPVAAQGTGEAEEPVLLYENPFDVDTGLIHISSVETDLQERGIVEMDGRTVLKMSGLKGNPNEFAIIDTNADLPAEAVAEFDMKLEPVDDGVGGTSAKGGFDFGMQLNETQTAVERQTWFAAENLNKFRIRTTGQGDIYLDSQNVKHNVWQHWRIEYKGNSLTVYIDDKKSYEGGLPGNVPAQAGLAGFMMWSEGNTYVDDLKVYEYQSKPLPDYGSDEELENAVSIGNDQLEVMVDKTFPQVLNYTLKETEGKIFAGRPKAEHTAYLTDDTAQEGTAYSAEVTQFTTTADAAEYTLHMEDFHGGLDVNYRIAVEGNEVVKTITDISGAGEPYLVSIKLDTPILRVKEVQNPQIAHNTERSPDRFSNYVGDQDADVIGALSQQGEGTSLTDWAFLYTDSVLGTAHNTLIDIPYEFEVAVDSEGKYAALYDREYYYRLAYLPNEDADGEKHLGELTLYDTGELFESRVLITGDANENGMMDWQDGANWVRSQLPEISEELKAFMDAGGTWQQCHGTFPNNPTSSEVKIPYDVYASEARKTYYLTDGAPQVYAIAGWQQHGHDWRWGDWEQPISPGAGGYEGALSAWEETLKYGSFISFHVNQEICVPEADSYDTNMVARQNDGSERLYTSVFGQGTFRVKSYFLD